LPYQALGLMPVCVSIEMGFGDMAQKFYKQRIGLPFNFNR
jgi:hypothetical protein